MNKKLEDFLKTGRISQDDYAFWRSRLEDVSFAVCDSILELFDLLPDKIGWLRIMQERKEAALASKNNEAWEKIVEEEASQFQALSLSV